mgnify:CR=1 FL=1
MIKSYTNGEWKEPGSLCQAVGIYKGDFHKIVSVVGGGGKTTVIRGNVWKIRMEGFHARFQQRRIYKKQMRNIFWESHR